MPADALKIQLVSGVESSVAKEIPNFARDRIKIRQQNGGSLNF